MMLTPAIAGERAQDATARPPSPVESVESMSKRECLRCGRDLENDRITCAGCGAVWPILSVGERLNDDTRIDEAIVWVLGAMITFVAIFLIVVAW
jgi:hypothetical protein